ncbi:oxidoreductase [Viridibacillus sp. FSL R5-0477]|uniref:Oxidoreductase n=1 Tax=Viridibacillus arenosi FSL R5-213 TaxID=1227360 RepID=W4F4Q3_9BACL|nr:MULTISPECIES: oxidoreductase [Viridibacillus]ETT87307.1 oxidoreductase [Viridibacillus arenosi FSL R5-213]OMC80098.1 oxidoreductase [Viridibacillus sp. FSL H8-0123]OMC91419.1 oxidoreductase [Viridibacillus arenosi]
MLMRSAIVVGATGLTGQELVKVLCESEEYAEITVIARRALNFEHPKLIVKIRQFDQLEEIDFKFSHELYCCLGTTRKKAGSKAMFEKVDLEYPVNIASIAKKCGIPHILVISAMGANKNSNFYYNQVKGKMEQNLMALELPQLSIFRPSLLLGNREEVRPAEKISGAVMNILNPIFSGPLKKYRAIAANTLAKAMYSVAIKNTKQKVRVLESAEISMIGKIDPLVDDHEEIIDEELIFNWEKRQDIFIEKEILEEEKIDKPLNDKQ